MNGLIAFLYIIIGAVLAATLFNEKNSILASSIFVIIWSILFIFNDIVLPIGILIIFLLEVKALIDYVK